jgi:hypothetical protein
LDDATTGMALRPSVLAFSTQSSKEFDDGAETGRRFDLPFGQRPIMEL